MTTSTNELRQVDVSWEHCVLVCSHTRTAEHRRAFCGEERGSKLRAWLKDRIRERGWRGRVIAVKTGCLGVCSPSGTTVALVPNLQRRQTFVVGDESNRESLWEKVVEILV